MHFYSSISRAPRQYDQGAMGAITSIVFVKYQACVVSERLPRIRGTQACFQEYQHSSNPIPIELIFQLPLYMLELLCLRFLTRLPGTELVLSLRQILLKFQGNSVKKESIQRYLCDKWTCNVVKNY